MGGAVDGKANVKKSHIPRVPLDLVEFVLIAGGLIVIAFLVGGNRRELQLYPFVSADAVLELRDIEQKYGPARNSEHGEEWIIRDFFGDRRGGTFVDVGANDYRHFSNTYYLDTVLGWSGIAIEPQTSFAAGYAAHRPRTTFVPVFVSDVSDAKAVLYVPPNRLDASGNRSAAGGSGTPVEVSVPTMTLNDVLDRYRVSSIDFLTMDIELGEPKALKGFSVRRFRPRLVCVEAHPAVRQEILDYFASADYVIVGKYLRADPANLWFSPRASATVQP